MVSVYFIRTKTRECQDFVEKVDEIRFTKVKQRQLNKFYNLLNKKEGNITGVSTQLNSSQGLVASQAGRCSPSPRGRKQSSFPGRQSGRHSPSPQGRKQFSFPDRQAGSNLEFHTFPGMVLPARQAVQLPLMLLQGKALPRQGTTLPLIRQAVKQ